jgi:hypothetical protein
MLPMPFGPERRGSGSRSIRMSSNSDLPKRESTGWAAASDKQMIKASRNVLHEMAKSALSFPGIPADEKEFLEIADHKLLGIDQLVAIIDKNLNDINRAAAMSCLVRAIDAVLVIGSRAVVNPISEKFIRDVKNERAAHARGRKEPRSKSMLVSIHRHTKIFWLKKAIHVGNASATATNILKDVNTDLIAEAHSKTTQKAIQHKLTKHWMTEISLEIEKQQNCPTVQSGT